MPYATALSVTFAQLRRHKLARVGAMLVALIAMVGLFAELLAGERPLICKYDNHIYILPALSPTSAPFQSVAEYETKRSKADWAVFPLVRHAPDTEDATRAFLPPMRGDHVLGTDGRGRDVLARLVFGARTAFTAGLAGMIAFAVIGVALGAFAGFAGGAVDALVTRLIEVLSAVPSLILVLVVQALLPKAGTYTLVVAIVLTRWTEVARLVRAEVMGVMTQDYILAARALGLTEWRILRRHVMPNAIAPAIVAGTFGIATIVLIESALGFLRVGLPKDTTSWGEILSEGRLRFDAWWLMAFPGLCVFLTVASLNLVGEALRDALDPRLRDAAVSHDEPPPAAEL
jgi:peptide/nickel transport system permease protein